MSKTKFKRKAAKPVSDRPKRGRPVKYGYNPKPISFKVTDDQLALLQADVDAEGGRITISEAARRRCFPEGPAAVRLVEHRQGFVDSDVPLQEAIGTTEAVLAAPWLRRHSQATGFLRWSVSGGGRFLMAEFSDGRDWTAARVDRGMLRGLPDWRGPQ